MIKKLRRNFILICTGSVSAIIIVLLGAMNISNYISVRKEISGMLNMIAENDGMFPADRWLDNSQINHENVSDFNSEPSSNETKKNNSTIAKYNDHGVKFNAETQFKTRYFVIRYDSTGAITDINVDNIAAITESGAAEYAKKVIGTGKRKGRVDSYYYSAYSVKNGNMLIFLDSTTEIEDVNDMILNSIVIAAGLLVLFVIIVFLAPRVIKPFADNMETQKRFITDASHELKTPLAIISANADVLSLSGNDNEWVRNIKHQTKRLSNLVNNLVMLSTLDEENKKLNESFFSMSNIVNESVEQFTTLAEIEGKRIESNVQPGVRLFGNEDAINQLIFILLDNAIKYSLPDGVIDVKLKTNGKAIVFTVYNTCEYISKSEMKYIFDRFYRADKSRSRDTGGYGIGLSLAHAIAEKHKGCIAASTTDEKSVTFTVTLKNT